MSWGVKSQPDREIPNASAPSGAKCQKSRSSTSDASSLSPSTKGLHVNWHWPGTKTYSILFHGTSIWTAANSFVLCIFLYCSISTMVVWFTSRSDWVYCNTLMQAGSIEAKVNTSTNYSTSTSLRKKAQQPAAASTSGIKQDRQAHHNWSPGSANREDVEGSLASLGPRVLVNLVAEVTQQCLKLSVYSVEQCSKCMRNRLWEDLDLALNWKKIPCSSESLNGSQKRLQNLWVILQLLPASFWQCQSLPRSISG